MFVAEHREIPASLPFTFGNLSISPDTAYWLRTDWLFTLLHVTAGSGIPVTEHWNEAELRSFTVNFAGETATAGAEIDSPRSPLAPGMPSGLTSPFCPIIPPIPWCPAYHTFQAIP